VDSAALVATLLSQDTSNPSGQLWRDRTMLVLSRKIGEKILIGKDISVTVVRVAQGMVRIGVEAPAELSIVREEIKDRPKRAPSPNGATAKQ
jgi:carbon storage regulator